MAIMQKNHMCFLTLLFLLPLTKGLPKWETRKLCAQTTDPEFCFFQIEADPRSINAHDYHAVLIIVISLTKLQVDDARTIKMDTVIRQYTGPIGRRRTNVCKRDYVFASNHFHKSWENALKKHYTEARRLATISTNAVINCQNIWRKGGPVQTSPFTEYNMNVLKFSGIINLLVQKLTHK